MLLNQSVILLADNDLDFLRVRKKLLEQAGYRVETATNPDEAREKLERGGIDLAVIDIRLEDNENEFDESGLNVALEIAPGLPKIMLTNYPSFEALRKVRRRTKDSFPAAIEFLDKQEGVEALVRSVQAALRLRNIFIVHGHDLAARDSVELLVQRLGLRPIILAEQPSGGRTIIDKLETYGESASYVIVVMTPDDVGYAKRETAAQKKNRARQTVVCELGYFVGKLGRGKVCVLHREDTEIFSDYQGVLLVRMDDADWKIKIAQEMKYAGIPVDLNDLFERGF
jgi:predicted nucleotide-binding protein